MWVCKRISDQLTYDKAIPTWIHVGPCHAMQRRTCATFSNFFLSALLFSSLVISNTFSSTLLSDSHSQSCCVVSFYFIFIRQPVCACVRVSMCQFYFHLFISDISNADPLCVRALILTRIYLILVMVSLLGLLSYSLMFSSIYSTNIPSKFRYICILREAIV